MAPVTWNRGTKKQVRRATNGTQLAMSDEAKTSPGTKNEQEASLPKVVRVFLVCATSIMANHAWQNRAMVTDNLYNDTQSPTEQTMISVFVYFALMGAIFLGGVVVSKVTVFAARFV
ncbi:hypothetical protein H257_11969 [Aphanomyces astaci]|uniref:Uncharacterized protein n=1 Tax=Aphanomyces astaci TaxID=112090 RepID=W4G1K1_APHAT|nr:hypothetical protein H257_11969 [Aphanomyces astaci]ETV73151.1 hypothetical protein H257_11969 [Aphanomyces astaci]|eukprot:XP_009837356.1 hypothetical protein H257_11969 [Aphanomyces astaci]